MLALMVCAEVVMYRECPSPGIRANCAAASVVPAPGLLSMMIGLDHTLAIFSATARATMSVAPPAAYGTTILTASLG